MPENKAKRARAPIGFLDLRTAVGSVRRRLYSSVVPTWVLEAAEANLSGDTSVVRSNNRQKPDNNEDRQGIVFIIQDSSPGIKGSCIIRLFAIRFARTRMHARARNH
jgi:hypothetical protein